MNSMENEGYYALLISIIANVTPDQAFAMYTTGKKPRIALDKRADVEMLTLRQRGYTNEVIGEMFGITQCAISRRVKRIAQELGIAI